MMAGLMSDPEVSYCLGEGVIFYFLLKCIVMLTLDHDLSVDCRRDEESKDPEGIFRSNEWWRPYGIDVQPWKVAR